MTRTAWIVILATGACGGGGDGASDAPVDAHVVDARRFDAQVDAMSPDGNPNVTVDEAPDCGGDSLVARGGDLALAVSALSIPELAASFDLDGDGTPDNKMAAVASLAQSTIDDGLANGTLVIPIEIFDRDADPDGCVKLATYTGSCATGTCNMTDAVADTVALDPASYDGAGVPYSRLRAMSTDAGGMLTSGVGPVVITVPITDVITLQLPITVQRLDGVLGTGPTAGLVGVKLGGTMQSFRLATVPMPDVPEIGTMPGDTLLDGIFANLLGPLLAMPQSPFMSGCRTADIDLDGDGLESFCDSLPDDATKRVDTCIDGDGTIVHDGDNGVARCTDTLVGGHPRFPDGVSAAVLLSANPAVIAP